MQTKQLPNNISIPDILNMQGQVARCYAETCFQKFATDNLQRLRGLPESELLRESKDLKTNLHHGFVATGMGDLQKGLLTVNAAKKRKAEDLPGYKATEAATSRAPQGNTVCCLSLQTYWSL